MEPTLVETRVSTHWHTKNMSLIKAVDYQNKEKEDWCFESKLLKGLLLVIKHASSSKQAQKVYSGSMYHFNSNMVKWQKVTNVASYDWLFIFADMVNPLNCFAIITNTPTKSYKYMEYSNEIITIGRIFYIIKPRRSISTLGQKLPLISSTKAFIPLKFLIATLAMKEENINHCNMTLPRKPGEMLYFASHNVMVEINCFEVIMTGVLCSGLFCDHSQPLQMNVPCGCMFEGKQGPCVTEYTLMIPSLSKISNNHDIESINECQSLRTTWLFLQDQTMQKANVKYSTICSAVWAMVKCINANGGWMIIGWFKKGEIEDSSNLQGERVESTSCTLYISLLIPMDESICNGTDITFNNM